MPTDHNSHHGRRPHYHRGRRGPDRRGSDRRPQSQQPEAGGREHLDIEQLMREIRSRISDRHGIDLSNQQIQELAARRLEAILDPRAIKPSLMDELRRAAGLPVEPLPSEQGTGEVFDASTLYASSNVILRFIRRLLNPLLRLLLDPRALIRAFGAQAQLNAAAEARRAEQQHRQAEWNGLHYEILRRLVTEIARASIETQQLSLRVESLTSRIDFNDRAVRTVEQALLQSKPSARAPETAPSSPQTSSPNETGPSERAAIEGPGEGRRRRRRRRGRRSGIGQMPVPGALPTAPANNLPAAPHADVEEAGGSAETGEADHEVGLADAPFEQAAEAPQESRADSAPLTPIATPSAPERREEFGTAEPTAPPDPPERE